MTKDTQHLDFLISQYVDQTLDATTRRTIEQQIAADPIAAVLYKDHCEVQDVLEDWGNRLPMINWDEFDGVLAARLEKEVPQTGEPVSPLRRWSRVLAAAAALFVAGTIGYTWHAFTTPMPTRNNGIVQTNPDTGPQHIVNFSKPAATGPSMDSVVYEHPPVISGGNLKVEMRQPSGSSMEPAEGTAINDKLKNPGSVVGIAVQKAHKPDRTDAPSIIY